MENEAVGSPICAACQDGKWNPFVAVPDICSSAQCCIDCFPPTSYPQKFCKSCFIVRLQLRGLQLSRKVIGRHSECSVTAVHSSGRFCPSQISVLSTDPHSVTNVRVTDQIAIRLSRRCALCDYAPTLQTKIKSSGIMESLPLSLPVITIQPSFAEVIQEVQNGLVPFDKFWVSCYKNSEPSVHSKISVGLDEMDRDLVLFKTVEGDAHVTKDAAGTYSVACGSLGIPPTKISPAVQEYRDEDRSNPTRPHRITAFSVSPDSSRFATGYMDGAVLLCPASPLILPRPSLVAESVNTTKTKVICRSHVSVVTSLKFFPSSRVILSSGQDFGLTVMSADLPDSPSFESRVNPARVMRGHSATVTSTAIIGVGRNVVSASLDSKIRLWDVPSGEAFTTLFAKNPITSMSLGDRPLAPPDGEESVPPPSMDNREVPETNSKLVFCGLKNGSFQLLDLGFKNSVYVSPSSNTSPLTSIAYSQSSNLLATGSTSGIVTIYDTRLLTTPVTSFSRMQTGIEDLAFVSRNNGSGDLGLAIATSDGLPYVASVVPEGPTTSTELVGVDCDAVRHISVRCHENRMEAWSASDDGIVRKYLV